MLNWILEEREEVKKAVLKYQESLSVWQHIFMNKKTLNKNIEYITKQTQLRYRANKLDNYLDEIKEERERIKDVVNGLNFKFTNEINNQVHSISKKIKPITISAYDNDDICDLKQTETIIIRLKPYEMVFIQEKLESSKSE